MILQVDSIFWTIAFIVIASILLWLMLWLASRLIISKSYASDKKIILLITAVVLVILIPIVEYGAGYVLGLVGRAFAGLRDLIDGGGQDYVSHLVVIVVFFVFMLILKFLCGMDWKDATWISFIALLLLYCLFSLVPELDFMSGLV